AGAAVAVLASSSSLHALYTGYGWVGPIAFGAVLVGATGGAARRLRVPVLLTPFLSLVVLAEYVVLLDARGAAWGYVVPTRHTWRVLWAATRMGLTDVRTFAAPVPTRTGLVLLGIAAVGAVAYLVDLVAVRQERPSLAGLVLLLLLVVPSGVRGAQVGWAPFVAGAAAWLALLAADSRRQLARWGTALPAAPAPREAQAAPGWRIGLASVALAVLVPAAGGGLVPTHGLLAGNGGGLVGAGGNTVTVVPPMVTVDAQLHDPRTIPLLEVRTTDPTYLRLTALDGFTGADFTLNRLTASPAQRVSHGLPPPPGPPIPTVAVNLAVRVSGDFAEHYLPVPYAVTQVSISGDWRLDTPTRTVFSTHTDTLGATYRATAQLPDPGPATLAQSAAFDPLRSPNYPAALAADTELPPSLYGLRALADQIAVQAHATTYFQAVVAIQDYLRGPLFSYSLSVPSLTGPGALETFLFQTHTGYCEQFATAMAALVRALGVPARVAVGFTPGTLQPDGSYLVTNHDAHAWPEVWFDQAGWLRFEPTPLTDGRALDPAYTLAGGAAVAKPGSPAGAQTAPHSSATPAPTRELNKLGKAFENGGAPAPSPGQRGPHHRTPVGLLVAGAVVLGLIGSGPGLGRRLIRRSRLRRGAAAGPAALAAAAWAEVLDDASDRGVPAQPSDSPRMAERRLAAALSPADPGARDCLAGLRVAAEIGRFAPDTPPQLANAPADLRRVRSALSSGLPLLVRIRAVMFPRTVWQRATHTVALGVADVLDGVDRGLAGLRRRLRRRSSAPGGA
ncbi:MAG: transglutaminase family protein, partial [Mycobacteriales bacterium]